MYPFEYPVDRDNDDKEDSSTAEKAVGNDMKNERIVPVSDELSEDYD